MIYYMKYSYSCVYESCEHQASLLLQVFFASVQSGGSSQIYFMTLGQNSLFSW